MFWGSMDQIGDVRVLTPLRANLLRALNAGVDKIPGKPQGGRG